MKTTIEEYLLAKETILKYEAEQLVIENQKRLPIEKFLKRVQMSNRLRNSLSNTYAREKFQYVDELLIGNYPKCMNIRNFGKAQYIELKKLFDNQKPDCNN